MKEERKAMMLSIGYGRGHEAAAQALAQEMRARGWGAEVIDVCAAARPRMFRITQSFYRECVRCMPWVWGIAYSQIDVTDWSRMLSMPGIAGSSAYLRDLLRREKPQLVVCTYPLYAYILDRLAREEGMDIPYAVVVTDALHVNSAWVRTRAPLICMPDTAGMRYAREELGVDAARLRVTGFPVRREFRPDAARRAPGEGGECLRVVYGAHARLHRVCADISALLAHLPGIQITLLGEEREQSIRKRLGAAAERIIFHRGGAGSLAQPLSRAHFYIGKAGAATVFEAYAAQTPVLVNYTLPGQEEGNQQMLIDDGAGRRVESAEELVQTIDKMLRHGATGWKQMVQNMRAAGRCDGAARTCDTLEKHFFG